METHEVLVGAGFLVMLFASMAADSGANTDKALGALLAGVAIMALGGIAYAIKQSRRRKRRR